MGQGWPSAVQSPLALGATPNWLLRPLQPTLTLATRHLRRQRIEPLAPRPTEAIEPRLHLTKRHRAELVHSTRALRTRRGEAALAKHAQVLRDARLRDVELALNRLDD